MRWILPVLLIVIGCGDIPLKQHAVYIHRVAEDISMAELWKCGLVPLSWQSIEWDGQILMVLYLTNGDTVSWNTQHPDTMGVNIYIGDHYMGILAEWISDSMLEVTMPYGKCYIWDGYYSCPSKDRGQVPQVFHCLN
ncbi:MAG: hypothetical protein QXS68_06620 [Candidatus Methanomethylicaceae archaeon]